MNAKETAVSNLISVELCIDCPLRAGHATAPQFIQVGGPSTSGKSTEIFIVSEDNLTGTVVDGARRPEELVEAFGNCEAPLVEEHLIKPDLVVCGAVAALRVNR